VPALMAKAEVSQGMRSLGYGMPLGLLALLLPLSPIAKGRSARVRVSRKAQR
jgi:hypothetical protein